MNADGTHLAWITLGSNIAPHTHLPLAVQQLQRLGSVPRVSEVWQSAAVGDVHQADFCNAAVLLETPLDVASLKSGLLRIERDLGRVRDPRNKNAARTIDLDLALYEDCVGTVAGCVLPDPEIVSRPFLAVPLAEVSPDTVHPLTGKTLRRVADEVPDRSSLQPRPDIQLSCGGAMLTSPGAAGDLPAAATNPRADLC